jgi:hypothetical protein
MLQEQGNTENVNRLSPSSENHYIPREIMLRRTKDLTD